MSFIKLEPIKGGHGGCLCCGYQHEVLPMDKLIAVGFGIATVTKDEEVIYDENSGCELWMTLEAEDFAKEDPDHDWRIHLVAPLAKGITSDKASVTGSYMRRVKDSLDTNK